MARASQLLGELLAHSAELNPRDRISWHTWRDIVGSKIAQRSKPSTYDGSVLTIVVSSPLWANELSLLQTTILERVRSKLPRIQSLRFQVGRVEPMRTEAARDVTSPAPLPAELESRIGELEDPELQKAIRDAAAYNLGLRQTRQAHALKKRLLRRDSLTPNKPR